MMRDDDSTRMAALLHRQRHAFLEQGPPALALRKDRLARLRAATLAHRTALQEAVSADFGHRSRHETDIMELAGVIQSIDYLRRHLRRFMRRERRHVGLFYRTGRAFVEHQPKGVVGVMAPWNYPISLTLIPLATALAAGNRAMLKPSELTPRTSEVMRRMLAHAFAEEEVATVLGGPEAGAAFSALPFDHLLFTGSTPVGRKVMRAASEIFGPVLPVRTYRTMDEAIGYVNARPRPLALYYFGPQDAGCQRLLERTTSGNVGINSTLMHVAQDDLPFGGIGPSGMGAYHGIEGFRAMSHAKDVFVQGRWSLPGLLHAPFGRFTRWAIAAMLGPETR